MNELDDAEVAAILHQVFAEQSVELFSEMEQALLALEREPTDAASLQTVFRVCHTLKGDALSLGFESLGRLAHALEDLLAAARSGELEIEAALISLLLEAVDTGRIMAANALEGQDEESLVSADMHDRIRSHLQAGNVTTVPQVAAQPAAELHEASHTPDLTPTLRVRVDLLDRLLNLAGEIAIGRGGMTERLSGDLAASTEELLEVHQELDPLVDELQQAVMALRLVPIAPLLRQQQRLVRDAAIAEGKQARLVVNGDGAELDTTIVEQLRDPLSHLMRNAIAHGIESEDERIRAGKSPEGQITLSAERKGASIFVDIRDDGRGLDADRIRSRAEQVGLLQKHEERSDSELFELIFEPGFSTLDVASHIAGRGVGMDVVRRNIEKVGGTVSIDSETGIGTHIQIELPLTVAIVDTLGVGVGGEDYFIPLNTVVECVELPQALRNDSAGGVLELRGHALPFIRLNRLLGTRKIKSSREHVIVIQHRGQRAGIAVDVLHGESQAVVKPLSALVPGTSGIAGTTIRSDGRVALLLDAPALLRAAVGWQTGGQHGGGAGNERSKTAGLTA